MAIYVLLTISLCFQISNASVTLTLPGQKNRWESLKLVLLILTSAPTILPLPNLTSLSSTLGSRTLQSPIQQSATQDLIPNTLQEPILTTLDSILLLFLTNMIAFSSMMLQSPNTISLFLSSQIIEQDGFIMQPYPNVTFPTMSLCPKFNVLAPPFFMRPVCMYQFQLHIPQYYSLNYSHADNANLLQYSNNQKSNELSPMIQHIKKLFLLIIALTCFTCFQRADYNLPLFAFAYFLWDYSHPNSQKARLFYLFLSTWVVDFIWLIYWGVTWSSEEYQNSGQSGSSTFVLAISIIVFIVKLGVILMLFFMEPECKLAIKNFLPNAKSIISPTPVTDPAPY